MEAVLKSCEHLSVTCEEVQSLAHHTMTLGNVYRDFLVPLSQGDRALMSVLRPFVCVWLLEIQPWPGRQEAGVGPAVSSERGSEEDSGPRGARGKLRFSALGSPGLRCQESRTQTQGLALSQAPPSSGPFPRLLQHCFLSYI